MRPLPVSNPTSRWASTTVDYVDEEDPDDPGRSLAPAARLEVFEDTTRQILSRNDSPDLHFRWTVNPYRGCFHGCAYCYARPTHEYLSFGAGTDFDRKIVVKPHAAALLRAALQKPSWRRELVLFSGVTDCYQPLEATRRLTRACLEVCRDHAQPVGVITKSALVERDIDVLVELSARASARVTVSVPFWDLERSRAMEPYVPTPARRMKTIERLARAGVDVGVNVAPIIPGLNDEEIGDILQAAKDAGATSAGAILLRLPGAVAPVFEARLRETLPLRADRVMRRIRETRGGALYDAGWGVRGEGTGPYATTIFALFRGTARRLGLATSWMDPPSPAPPAEATTAPTPAHEQLSLFGGRPSGSSS